MTIRIENMTGRWEINAPPKLAQQHTKPDPTAQQRPLSLDTSFYYPICQKVSGKKNDKTPALLASVTNIGTMNVPIQVNWVGRGCSVRFPGRYNRQPPTSQPLSGCFVLPLYRTAAQSISLTPFRGVRVSCFSHQSEGDTMPITIHHRERGGCSLQVDGAFTLAPSVLRRVNWEFQNLVMLAHLFPPLVLLLGKTINPRQGYPLTKLTPNAQSTGGRIYSRTFHQQVLKKLLPALPMKLDPIFIDSKCPYALAFIPIEPRYLHVEFSVANIDAIAQRQPGVYKLCRQDGTVIYIGRGNLRDRLHDHLRTEEFRTLTQSVQYLPLQDEAEANIMEKVLYWQHVQTYGDKPDLNRIAP
jgi:hypothetical protein